MVSRLPKIDADGEVGDLSAVDPAVFKPVSALPPSLQTKLRGRPKAMVTKEPVKIRLDADVLMALRATGDGWQTRINDTLRASLQLAGKLC
ncbi:BrnA antitoxin family protein [Rhodoferax sp.]|uniref:BrnA antitoxin family protein n=1 Tax=Rhodoferax sp. TaxID=50421 RepID=UPI002611AB3D|nr:BrnA antitoxin family protein [Rhodoferax sp.]MDD2924507.1 BrnA antitoxin family protein [Rhodoferax sp.]